MVPPDRIVTGDGIFELKNGLYVLDVGPVNYAQIATPATPASGFVSLYAKSDKTLYIKDSTGTETQLATGASSSKQVAIGTAVTSNVNAGSTGSFVDFTTGPTLTFTATASAKYIVYCSTTTFSGTPQTWVFRLNSNSSPTVNFSQEASYDSVAAGNRTPVYVWQIVTLVSGNSYTWSIQVNGLLAAGTITLNNSVLAGGTAIVAQQIA